MNASLLAFSSADYSESVVRGDHYGQSNDSCWQESRWRQGRCGQARRKGRKEEVAPNYFYERPGLNYPGRFCLRFQ